MAKDRDLAELARNYLDLWEQQLSDYVQNPDMIQYWAQSWGRVMDAMADDQFGDRHGDQTGAETDKTKRPGAAGPPSDLGLDELRRLAERVTALENSRT